MEKCGCRKVGKDCSNLCMNRLMFIECNNDINCDFGNSGCKNRIITTYYGADESRFDVKSCGPKGLGVITKKSIPKNSFICEYLGTVLNEVQFEEKKNEDNSNMNYIISQSTKPRLYIDASIKGNSFLSYITTKIMI